MSGGRRIHSLSRVRERTDDRFLPVLVLAAQAAVWLVAPLVGTAPTAAEFLSALLVGGLVTAALAVRRTRPVPVLALVAAATAIGAGPLPAGGVAVLGTAGVALALHTVASERDTTTALLCVGTLALWQLLQNITLHGLGDTQGLDLVLTALLYAAATGTGMRARRLRAAHQAGELRLQRAEAERHRLPAAERRRMERELHDVSAHHLTAVVVTVEAALGLRERRPELADQATGFAAGTGREVTRALSAVRAPAPSSGERPEPQERLRELVAGFRPLGLTVTCEIDALPEGTVGDAAYGIVREALTNIVRHAPGAATSVRCVYGERRTEIAVTNAPMEAPANGAPRGAALGGGRGQNLLRGRAREAGGTLTSGPTRDGGWEVRAVLPGRTTAQADTPGVPRAYRVAQFAAAAGLCVQPLLGLLVLHENEAPTGPGVSPGALFALLAAAQALTLLWTGRAPRAALGTLLVLAGLWPVAMAASAYTGAVLVPPALSLLLTCAALALVALRAEDSTRARAVAYVACAAAVQAGAAAGAVLSRGVTAPAWAAVGAASAVAALAACGAWALGARYARRRRRELEARDDRVAAWTEEAVRAAWAERRRITEGLETTVLARTAEVVEEAEAGRLAPTAERAREALAAMRALLETVREGEPHAGLRPQPTLQALDLLVQQCRATGREVEVRLTERVPERLPAETDLAAYRAAETVLEAGGDDPAVLVFDTEGQELTLTATGVPRGARPAVRETLVTRAAALGGSVTSEAPGTLLLRLPLRPEDRADAAPSDQGARRADDDEENDEENEDTR